MRPPILVVGPGAVGLALAARWRLAGEPVAVLGRSPASERKLARGIRYETADGKVSKTGPIVPARTLRGPARAVFLCVKSHNVMNAARAAKRWTGHDTPVVSLQNGIGNEQALRRTFGPARHIRGTCYFAADRLDPNSVRLNGGGVVSIAKTGENASALQAAHVLLDRAGWEVHVKEDEDRMLWTKLVFNAATNLLGAACAAENSRLAEDPALRELMLAALKEAVAAGKADGRSFDHEDMEDLLLRNCRAAARQRNSMLQDLAAGRRTERGAIAGPVLAAARRRGVPTPVLSGLDAVVGRLEKRLAA
jgi:2-dehydropantoate 2-reductase